MPIYTGFHSHGVSDRFSSSFSLLMQAPGMSSCQFPINEREKERREKERAVSYLAFAVKLQL
jgi:hypothetical protein